MLNKVWALGLTLVSSIGCQPAGSTSVVLDKGDIAIKDVGEPRIWATSDTITEIADIAFPSDGSVWVLNDKAPFMVKFDSTGKVERAWGVKGGGPGEFLYPQDLLIANGGREVWVRDLGKNGFLNVSRSADDAPLIKPDQSVRLIAMGFAPDERIWSRHSDSGVLVVRATGGHDFLTMYQSELVELKADGSITPKFNIAGQLGDPAKSYPGASEYLPYPLVARCPDGTTNLYDPTANLIRRFRADGGPIDSISLPRPLSVEITFDRVFDLFHPLFTKQTPPDVAKDTANLRAQIQRKWNEEKKDVAKVFPEYFDFQCDQTNRLWIQPFDVEAGDLGRGRVWYQVEPRKTPNGIRLPAGFRPVNFAADRVWGVVRDANDIPSIAWVSLPGARSGTGSR